MDLALSLYQLLYTDTTHLSLLPAFIILYVILHLFSIIVIYSAKESLYPLSVCSLWLDCFSDGYLNMIAAPRTLSFWSCKTMFSRPSHHLNQTRHLTVNRSIEWLGSRFGRPSNFRTSPRKSQLILLLHAQSISTSFLFLVFWYLLCSLPGHILYFSCSQVTRLGHQRHYINRAWEKRLDAGTYTKDAVNQGFKSIGLHEWQWSRSRFLLRYAEVGSEYVRVV